MADSPMPSQPVTAPSLDDQHEHEWRYVRTFENFFDGDEEDIYECHCGARERRYVPR